jgi:hypothetical protein
VTTATRSEALPGIPSVGDFLSGFDANSWYGVGAPKNTPAEIAVLLEAAIRAAAERRGEGHGNCLLQNNPMQSRIYRPGSSSVTCRSRAAAR